MKSRIRYGIGHALFIALSPFILAACSQEPNTATSPPAPEQAASSAATPTPTPNATATPTPTPMPTPVVKRTRIIPTESVTRTHCLVRKVPDGTGGEVELRLPIAAVDIDEWATNADRDIPLVVYTPSTYCKPGNFSGTGFTLRIEKQNDERFNVTVRHKVDPEKPVLSQIFELPKDQPYLQAKADGCTPDGGACGAYDGLDAYIYIADVRNDDGDLAKLVLLDLFALGEMKECNDERPSSPNTVMNDGSACPVPPWIYQTFGVPENTQWPLNPVGVVGTRQTGSGGGYEPPP